MENILKIVVENYKNKYDVANATPSRADIFTKKRGCFKGNSSLQKMENILKIVVKNYKNKFDLANATPSRAW